MLKHGHSKNQKGTPTYVTWQCMKSRCNLETNKKYHNYGARGIKVCKRWEKFENFLADMGERPKGMTLNRKDNNKGYSKLNCVWSTMSDQIHNKRKRPGCSSQYFGVRFRKSDGRWIATIRKDYVAYSLGMYDLETDAARAYNKKAKELYGKNAQLNKLKQIGAGE